MLKSDYYDLVFSISVLEHIPKTEIRATCEEMYRIVKHGGVVVHSLDLSPENAKTIGKEWFDCLFKAGFQIDDDVNFNWISSGNAKKQCLMEPLSIVYQYYGGRKVDMYEEKKHLGNYCYGTIAIVANKK